MRSGIWPLGGGGSSAPSTSTSAAAQAASTSNNSDAGKYAGVWRRSAMSKNAFASSSILIESYFAANCTRGKSMPDAIWIDRSAELESLARTLESQSDIGLDTEFLRERTSCARAKIRCRGRCQTATPKCAQAIQAPRFDRSKSRQAWTYHVYNLQRSMTQSVCCYSQKHF